MKHLYKVSFTLICLMILNSSIFSQTNRFWTAHKEKELIVTDKSVARLSFPTVFKLFDLNFNEMHDELFKVVGNAQKHSTWNNLLHTISAYNLLILWLF